MTATFATEEQVVDLVGRAMEHMQDEIAAAVALAQRLYTPRGESPEGGLTIAGGTVVDVFPGWCTVAFDTDQGAIAPSAVATLGSVAAGQRVAVLHIPPNGALVIGATSGGTDGGSSGSAVALWELPGPVIPVDVADSPNIPVVVSGDLSSVTLSLDEAPATGLQCVVDVFLNGVSMFPVDKPTLAEGVTLINVPISPQLPVIAFTDVVSAAVLTPAGRTLTIALA